MSSNLNRPVMLALLSMSSSSPRLFSFNRPLTTTANWPSLSLNTNSPSLWLALYFFFNLSLTLYNKSVLIHFPFPYTLTAIHALCGTIGTWLLLRYQAGGWRAVLGLSPANKKRRKRSPTASEKDGEELGPGVPRLNTKESIVLFLFSILYTINIVVSNASLRLVTVPFHQVVRAATPFFTLLFSAIILRNSFKCTTRKVLCLVPVVAGVGFATYGDYYFTTLGFLLTLLGTVLAALKTIITHLILIKPSQSQPLSLTTNKEPTLPLHSPVGYSTVPLPSPSSLSPTSEKDNVYYRHRTLLSVPPAPPRAPTGSPAQQIGIENLNDSLLLSASQYPPSPYSPPAYTLPSSPSSQSLAPSSSHLLSPSPSHCSPSLPTSAPTPPPTWSSKIPKLKLTPLHLLYLLSPLAFIQTTLLAHWTGELSRVGVYLASLSSTVPTGGGGAAADMAVAMSGAGGTYLTRIGEWVHLSGLGGFQLSFSDTPTSNIILPHTHTHIQNGILSWKNIDPRLLLLLNGIMAFWLNVVSFNANRRVGALGMTVAGNVKQVLTIVLGVLIFDLRITRENAVGVVLTVLGGAAYAFVELREREGRREKEKERRG